MQTFSLTVMIVGEESHPQGLKIRKTFRLHEHPRSGTICLIQGVNDQSCFIGMQTIIMNDRYHRPVVDQIAMIFKKYIEWLKILQDLPHVSEKNCTNLQMPNDIHKCHLQILPTNAQTMTSGGF